MWGGGREGEGSSRSSFAFYLRGCLLTVCLPLSFRLCVFLSPSPSLSVFLRVERGVCWTCMDRLSGLVVKVSASRAKDSGFDSHLRRDFSGSSHTSDLKIGTPVATLPGAWRYRVSIGTGRPGVSIL